MAVDAMRAKGAGDKRGRIYRTVGGFGRGDYNMIEFELLRDRGVLVITPTGPLEKKDFERLTSAVDPFLAEKGNLTGLVVRTNSFPGWKSFDALKSHLKFVGDHHKKVKRVAVVTDSKIGEIVPNIAKHFVAAEIKHFGFDQKEEAMRWIEGG
jgi:hypothetical protein